jgi:ABC-type branched-subunit amino acid transport system substrate-binding protein
LATAAVVALVGAVLPGCGQPEGEGDPELTIYVSAPLTGPAGVEGRDAADGAKLALADAEGEAGGIAVTAQYLDVAGRNESRSGPVSAGRNARTATEDSTTIAYIGELDSAASRTSVPITNSAGILQVAPGSGATDLVVEETFDDSVPKDVQSTGERTFARVLPSDEDVQEQFGDKNLISGPAFPEGLPLAGQEILKRFREEYDREPGPWVAYGYEAMASALAAVDRADDPLSRSSVVTAYFDGTERESVLGTYSITDEGETTLDEPLSPYLVTGDGTLSPAPPDQGD